MSVYRTIGPLVILFFLETDKLWFMAECLDDRLEHSISVVPVKMSDFFFCRGGNFLHILH